jgi:penicillin-binding protein 2
MFKGLIRKIIVRQKKTSSEDLIFWGGSLNLGDQRLKERNRVEWVEGAFVNYTEEELSSTNQNYLGISLSHRRLVVLLVLLLSCIGILLVRAVYLQAYRGEYYMGIAEKNRIRIYNLIAPRGIIYDANGVALVKNVPDFAVFVVPFDLRLDEKGLELSLAWLRETLGEEAKDNLNKILNIKATRKEYFEPILLAEGLDYEKAMAMRIESVKYAGVSVEVVAKRFYLTNQSGIIVESLAHLLGYEGKITQDEFDRLKGDGYLFNDYVGKTGVEATFEKVLRGQYGKEQIEIDSTGKAVKILAKKELRKGDNVYLSIDLVLQTKLEEIIQNQISRIGKRRAVAILTNPQTGKVLSLVSLPGFDNNLFSGKISQEDYSRLLNDVDKPFLNRAVSGEYPSGSIIKPIIAFAALMEKVVTEKTVFLSNGGLRIGQWFFPDWRAGGHGLTDVRKSLADSVNTFFYIVGGGWGDVVGLGPEKIKEYGEKFGLGKQTKVDLLGERDGFLPTPAWRKETLGQPWYIGDTYHLAIGQGDLLVTPMQVANYTNALANGGKFFRPELVDKIFNQTTQSFDEVKSDLVSQEFVGNNNLEVVRQGMRQAVTRGSAKILNGLPVTSGAKTGTAQWNLSEKPHAWFICFAPYENPELALIILVEDSGEGSAISAPIAYEFLNWYYREYKRGAGDE